MPSNIMKQKGSPYFYAVVAVPADVRSILGKTSFRKSLKTTDKRKAQAKAFEYVEVWKKTIDAARMGSVSSENSELCSIILDIKNLKSQLETKPDDQQAQAALDAAHDLLEKQLLKHTGAHNVEDLSSFDQEKIIYDFKIMSRQKFLFAEFI